MSCSITFGLTVPLLEWTELRPYAGHTFEHLHKLKPATLRFKHRDQEVVWNPNPASQSIYSELLKILEYLPGRLAGCNARLENDADHLDYRTEKMSPNNGSCGLINVLLHWRRAMTALKARELQETTDYAWCRLYCLRDDFSYSFDYSSKLEKLSLTHCGVEKELERVDERLVQLKKMLEMKAHHQFYHECIEFLMKVDQLRWALHLNCRFAHPMLIGSWLPITLQKRSVTYGQLTDDYYTYVETETQKLRNLGTLYYDHVDGISTKTPQELITAQKRPASPLSDVSDDTDTEDETNNKPKKTKTAEKNIEQIV